jgi:hypothetical protein
VVGDERHVPYAVEVVDQCEEPDEVKLVLVVLLLGGGSKRAVQ